MAEIEPLEAGRLAVITGAGISAASGLATFRGTSGLWDNQELLAASSASGYRDRLELLWSFWGGLRGQIDAAEPNAAHRALADWETGGNDVVVITQNIDELHQRAGSRQVIELHGNLFRTRCCYRKCKQEPWADRVVPDGVPVCPTCERGARPDVVLFEEQLPRLAWTRAIDAIRSADAVLVVGTSGVVWPANTLVGYAKERWDSRTRCILVNAEEWQGPDGALEAFDDTLIGPAEEILPRLLARP